MLQNHYSLILLQVSKVKMLNIWVDCKHSILFTGKLYSLLYQRCWTLINLSWLFQTVWGFVITLNSLDHTDDEKVPTLPEKESVEMHLYINKCWASNVSLEGMLFGKTNHQRILLEPTKSFGDLFYQMLSGGWVTDSCVLPYKTPHPTLYLY